MVKGFFQVTLKIWREKRLRSIGVVLVPILLVMIFFIVAMELIAGEVGGEELYGVEGRQAHGFAEFLEGSLYQSVQFVSR